MKLSAFSDLIKTSSLKNKIFYFKISKFYFFISSNFTIFCFGVFDQIWMKIIEKNSKSLIGKSLKKWKKHINKTIKDNSIHVCVCLNFTVDTNSPIILLTISPDLISKDLPSIKLKIFLVINFKNKYWVNRVRKN